MNDPKGRHITGTHLKSNRVKKLVDLHLEAKSITMLAELRRLTREELNKGMFQLLPSHGRQLEEALHLRMLQLVRRASTPRNLCFIYNTVLTWRYSPAIAERLEVAFAERMAEFPPAAPPAMLNIVERVAAYCADSVVLHRTDAHRSMSPALCT